MVAAAVVGGAVIGAGGSLIGAHQQANAAQNASQTQMQMYLQSRKDLLPYITGGAEAFDKLGNRINRLTSPIRMNQAMLERTPGYQFTLQQGLKSTQNSMAARGLGSSGAALKGAAQYATGLASNTYQQQFNNILQQRQNAYNMLSGMSQIGANAGAQSGQNAVQTGSNIGSNMIGSGNAQAAGIMGVGNAVNQGIGYYMMNGLINPTTPIPSDRRLKSNIRRIGTHLSGLPWYRYIIGGVETEGVMADEVLAVRPDAVITNHPSGFLHVNYGAL